VAAFCLKGVGLQLSPKHFLCKWLRMSDDIKLHNMVTNTKNQPASVFRAIVMTELLSGLIVFPCDRGGATQWQGQIVVQPCYPKQMSFHCFIHLTSLCLRWKVIQTQRQQLFLLTQSSVSV